MYDAMAVNVAEAIENLPKQTPGTIDVIVQAILDQVTQGLEMVSLGRFLGDMKSTYMLLAVLHLDVEGSQDSRSHSSELGVFRGTSSAHIGGLARASI